MMMMMIKISFELQQRFIRYIYREVEAAEELLLMRNSSLLEAPCLSHHAFKHQQIEVVVVAILVVTIEVDVVVELVMMMMMMIW